MNKKYTLNYTGKFKKDLKLCKKRGMTAATISNGCRSRFI